MTAINAESWAVLMGRDMERADLQPLQSVQLYGDRAIKLSNQTLKALGFSKQDRLRVKVKNGRCLLCKATSRGSALQGGRVRVSARAAEAMSRNGGTCVIVGSREGQAEIMPVRVEEHGPDVLGPRFVDELSAQGVLRHATPGLPRQGWTPKALGELEGLLCSEPFCTDPVAVVAKGDDWVGWMTRNRLLEEPGPGDEELRERLVREVLYGREADGTWGAVPATAYAILRLLALGEPVSSDAIQQAASWLLSLPEPPPRPGMWMLTPEYLTEWLSKRQPGDSRDFGPTDFQWTGPDEEINFFCWDFPAHEQDQFRGQEMQRVIPTCARHHAPACEPRMVHTSALVAHALLRCGYADDARLRRYVNTVFHLGGEWGYWCGCGALGLYDSDIPAVEDDPDFDVRAAAEDGQLNLRPWRWSADTAECALLANQPNAPERGTHLEPFSWHRLPGQEGAFALLGTGWQNGDCWAKTNRALAQHPSCRGSLVEDLAIFQASRYQTSLGEWDQAFPAGMLAFLSVYSDAEAKSLVAKTVPWLREHQADDGLWHHEELPRNDWGKPAAPPEPRLATYHILAGLRKFGLLSRLRP
jgi:hypothetical protein